MMRMANGEIDNVSGSASCASIKNSSEDLEIYYIVVCSTQQMCFYLIHIVYKLYESHVHCIWRFKSN